MGERLPHRWSVGHNYLSGITLGRWLRLLSDNGFDIDLVYGHRVAFVTLLAGCLGTLFLFGLCWLLALALVPRSPRSAEPARVPVESSG